MRLAALRSVAVILTVGALLLTGPAALRARANAASQASRVDQVDGLIRRISTRRAQSPPWTLSESTGASLPERLAAAVASTGLPAGVLVTVSPGRQEQVSVDPPVSRQGATVVLGGLTLPQLARILDKWRKAEPAWVVGSIEISPESKGKAEPGTDLPLRATLGLERVATVEEP